MSRARGRNSKRGIFNNNGCNSQRIRSNQGAQVYNGSIAAMNLTERSYLVDYQASSLSISQNDSSEQTSRVAVFWRKVLIFFYADKITREQLLLAISVICLMIATAGERVTFKMAVDRMVPFRFVLIQLIFLVSVLTYSTISYLKQGQTSKISDGMKDFPHSKLLIMATLDTVQFAGLAVSAAGVSPAMTVILLHTSTPFLVLGSRYTFPDRTYSIVQMRGVQLIALAVMISLVGSLSHFLSPGIHGSDSSSICLYFCMAALHGLATLYKEKSIISWSQPMDIHYLSSWLFFYQFLVALVLSPFIYLLQGISSGWVGFPLDSFFDNIRDGLFCFLGSNPDELTRYDSAYATCSYSYLLIVGYVISNVIVLECIGRVLQSNNLILGRSMAAAVFLSFLALGIYDTKLGFQDGLFGSAIDLPDVMAIIILLVGMEVYGHDPEPDVEVLTHFSP